MNFIERVVAFMHAVCGVLMRAADRLLGRIK